MAATVRPGAAGSAPSILHALRTTEDGALLSEVRRRGVHRDAAGNVVVPTLDASLESLEAPWLAAVAPGHAAAGDAAASTSNRALLFLEPPDHDRLRAVVVSALRSRTLDHAGAVEARLGRGGPDLAADVIVPAVVGAVSSFVGFPADSQEAVGRATRATSDAFDPFLAATDHRRAVEGSLTLMRLADRVARTSASDTFVGALRAAEIRGEITQRELLSNIVSLLSAGIDTTVGLLTSAIATLADEPALRRAVAGNPNWMRRFVEEVVRLEPPAQVLFRVATANGRLGGMDVEAGESVVILLRAANRDPRHFPDSDRIDLGRKRASHIGFGAGLHQCVGIGLARRSAPAALGAVLAHHPNLDLDLDQAIRRPHVVFRSFDSLPLRA